MTSAELLVPGPLRIGSRVRIRQPRLPVAVWEVTELVEPVRFVWVAKAPGVEAVAGHEIQPTANGVRVVATIEQRGLGRWLIGQLTGGLTRRYLAIEGDRLKERVVR